MHRPGQGRIGLVPELPEVESLAIFLRERAVGRIIDWAASATFAVLKTYQPDLSVLTGREITGVARHGKFLDLTEAGTRKRLAVYLVEEPAQVPGIASLGPDPLADSFTAETLAGLLAGRRTQIKGVLRDQKIIAGIGNAYSDEVLHAARMSPFKLAASLTPDEVGGLYTAMRGSLKEAVARSAGMAAGELKAEKKAGLRVHGRAGQPCPVCGDTVREVSFADSALQYCPTCQTGGKPLADRRMSRLLK
jgi:formamidopyrimidine-DNA glycosylase